MRGISTAPLILAVLIVLVTAGISAILWYQSQQKAAEQIALLNSRLVDEQAKCLNAIAGPNGTIIVGGVPHNGSYTGLGCYVDSSTIVVVQWNK
jgi:membrane protein implicated in regulation of membrane protease activity